MRVLFLIIIILPAHTATHKTSYGSASLDPTLHLNDGLYSQPQTNEDSAMLRPITGPSAQVKWLSHLSGTLAKELESTRLSAAEKVATLSTGMPDSSVLNQATQVGLPDTPVLDQATQVAGNNGSYGKEKVLSSYKEWLDQQYLAEVQAYAKRKADTGREETLSLSNMVALEGTPISYAPTEDGAHSSASNIPQEAVDGHTKVEEKPGTGSSTNEQPRSQDGNVGLDKSSPNSIGAAVDISDNPSNIASRENLAMAAGIVPSSMSITICVPCIPRDVDVLEHQLIPSMVNQTILPTQVIIALSETSNDVAGGLERRWSSMLPNVEVRVSSTTEKQTPGQNRNRAAEMAAGDIITYIDADDMMHPQRLEVVSSVLQRTHAYCVLHGFTMTDEYMSVKFDPHSFADYETMCLNPNHGKMQPCWGDDGVSLNFWSLVRNGSKAFSLPHDGHSSCLKEVYHKCKYPPQRYGEDSTFNCIVRETYGNESFAFVALPLTKYLPSDNVMSSHTKVYPYLEQALNYLVSPSGSGPSFVQTIDSLTKSAMAVAH